MDELSLFLVTCCEKYKSHVRLVQTVFPNDVSKGHFCAKPTISLLLVKNVTEVLIGICIIY